MEYATNHLMSTVPHHKYFTCSRAQALMHSVQIFKQCVSICVCVCVCALGNPRVFDQISKAVTTVSGTFIPIVPALTLWKSNANLISN